MQTVATPMGGQREGGPTARGGSANAQRLGGAALDVHHVLLQAAAEGLYQVYWSRETSQLAHASRHETAHGLRLEAMEPVPALLKVAGFQAITTGRFWGDHRGGFTLQHPAARLRRRSGLHRRCGG